MTAFVNFFSDYGLEKTKKLIDMKDLFTFGTEAQNEEILGGNIDVGTLDDVGTSANLRRGN